MGKKKITLAQIIPAKPVVSERARIMQATEQFRDYVRSFYGPKGVYDMGATAGQIADATVAYLERLKTSPDQTWGGGDSLDREHVRDILIEKFGLKFPDRSAA